MPKYVKKPIPIDAIRMYKEFYVDTNEGRMRGKPGDYLVTGIRGEQYPVDRKIFEESYMRVRDPIKPSPLSDEEKVPLED